MARNSPDQDHSELAISIFVRARGVRSTGPFFSVVGSSIEFGIHMQILCDVFLRFSLSASRLTVTLRKLTDRQMRQKFTPG